MCSIWEVRRKLKLSRCELAKKIGVTEQTVYGWEKLNKNPSKENMEKVTALSENSSKPNSDTLYNYRIKQKMSQMMCAVKLGVSLSCIRQNDSKPGSPLVKKLQTILEGAKNNG